MSKTYHVNEEVDSHNTWISWVDSGYDKVVSKIPISTSVNSQVMIWPDRVMTTIKQTRTKKRTSFSNHTTQNVAWAVQALFECTAAVEGRYSHDTVSHIHKASTVPIHAAKGGRLTWNLEVGEQQAAEDTIRPTIAPFDVLSH